MLIYLFIYLFTSTGDTVAAPSDPANAFCRNYSSAFSSERAAGREGAQPGCDRAPLPPPPPCSAALPIGRASRGSKKPRRDWPARPAVAVATAPPAAAIGRAPHGARATAGPGGAAGPAAGGGGAAAAGAGPGPRSLDSGGEMAAPVSTKAAWKLRECPPGPHPATALAVVRASPLRAGGLGPSTGLAAR